jgi:glycosyltransferase involved in cell wall biosynthesis
MEPKQQIDIVLTTWKREWATELCIRALRKNTLTPFRLIIIDNGSIDEYQKIYLNNADVYVKLDENRGLEYAKNLGMQFVESPMFISTDNDILPYYYENPDWVKRLIDLMNQYPEYGAIALRPQVLVGTGNIFDKVVSDITPFGHVPGYGRIMRTQLTKDCGAWNDKRPLRGHEEYWIGEKMAQKGYKMAFATNVKCWHLFGNQDTDLWGYAKGTKPQEHGHNEVAGIPGNDKEEIKKGVGIEI